MSGAVHMLSVVRKQRLSLSRGAAQAAGQIRSHPLLLRCSCRVRFLKLQVQTSKTIYTFVPTVDFNFSLLSVVEIVIKSRESFPGFVLGHFRFKLSCVGTPSAHTPTPRVVRVFGGARVEMRGR